MAMGNRADDLRRRMAKRKRDRSLGAERMEPQKQLPNLSFTDDEEKYGGSAYHTYDPGGDGGGSHPLFKPDVFMFKLLIGACLVLAAAIVFKNDSPPFEKVQSVVTSTFEEDFQFAMISKWYGDQFGDPLALIKTSDQAPKPEDTEFTAPASGKVLETFEDNGQGVMVETSSNLVEAMNEGIVVEIGKKEGSGLTVIVQHDDSTESWYGNLEEVKVSLYDFVESGKEIGKIKAAEDQKGTYYFAIKKGDQFIDPIQVISFD